MTHLVNYLVTNGIYIWNMKHEPSHNLKVKLDLFSNYLGCHFEFLPILRQQDVNIQAHIVTMQEVQTKPSFLFIPSLAYLFHSSRAYFVLLVHDIFHKILQGCYRSIFLERPPLEMDFFLILSSVSLPDKKTFAKTITPPERILCPLPLQAAHLHQPYENKPLRPPLAFIIALTEEIVNEISPIIWRMLLNGFILQQVVQILSIQLAYAETIPSENQQTERHKCDCLLSLQIMVLIF